MIGSGTRTGIALLAALLLALVGGAGLAETVKPASEEAAAEKMITPLVPVLELPAAETGTVVEIPVEQDSLTNSIPPREENYLYEDETGNPTGYADPSITVNIGRGRIYDTDYIYARVKIASASQLRTLMASPVNSLHTSPGHDLAKRVQAVIAINGDYAGGEDVKTGTLMRQGKQLRFKNNGNFDVLVIDRAGDLRIFRWAQDEDLEPVMEEAVQIFTFGPALILDGEPVRDGQRINLGKNKAAQRMAICQTGPLEYLLITSEGPEDPGSAGLTIDQFTDLLASMPEIQTAYNLDGGSSSTMVFRKDGKNWKKINAPNNKKVRPLKDIIYFASAWEPEGE